MRPACKVGEDVSIGAGEWAWSSAWTRVAKDVRECVRYFAFELEYNRECVRECEGRRLALLPGVGGIEDRDGVRECD